MTITDASEAALACIPVMLADIIVVGVTWMKTYRQVRDSRDIRVEASASRTMLADGMVFSLFLCASLRC